MQPQHGGGQDYREQKYRAKCVHSPASITQIVIITAVHTEVHVPYELSAITVGTAATFHHIVLLVYTLDTLFTDLTPATLHLCSAALNGLDTHIFIHMTDTTALVTLQSTAYCTHHQHHQTAYHRLHFPIHGGNNDRKV